jgi:phosphate transport system ATP-binding protein
MPDKIEANKHEQGGRPHGEAARKATNNDVVIDCHIKELYYGTFKAVRDTAIPVKKNTITAFIGAPTG